MANMKTLGVVLLIGAITAYLVVRESGILKKNHNNNQIKIGDHKTGDSEHHWSEWKKRHGRTFGSAEDSVRHAHFHKTADWVTKHNARPNKTYEVEVNAFAVYTDEEFAAMFLGDQAVTVEEESNVELLDTPIVGAGGIDWTTKGAVTPIKNQGSCGSCWSFSATGALEGLKAVKDGKIATFSEQQLIDCSGSYGNNGCSGGLAMKAFDYVKANGIVESSAYGSYKAKAGTCSIPSSAAKFKISGYTKVSGTVSQMQAALNKQPCAISVQADSQVFRNYKSGILNSADCGTSLNHAILAVGYDAGNYWKVKNSWGTGWGQSGYAQIAMKEGAGICGINQRMTYPNA